MHLTLILLLVLLLGTAYFSYYRTVPPLSRRVRSVLLPIRMAAYVLLVLLFVDPRCTRRGSITDSAQIAVVIDKSESMGLPASREGGGTSRFQEAMVLAGRVDSSIASRGGATRRFYFANDLIPESIQNVSADGLGTNIAGSLRTLHEKLEGEHCTAVVLLTDGADTRSELLVEDLPPLRIFTIGLGDTAQAEDVRVKEVDYNPLVRAPSRQTVRAILSNSGARSKRTSITLLKEGSILLKKEVQLEPFSEMSVDLPVEVEEPGRKSYEISIDVDGPDAEESNNRRELIIDAEKAEIAVLIVDQLPTWEHHFFTDLLKSEETISFDLVGATLRPGQNQFIDPADFSSVVGNYDVLVLSTMTAQFVGRLEADAIIRFITEEGKGLLVLPGPGSLFEHAGGWNLLQPVLPVTGAPPCRFVFTYTEVVPGEQAAFHAATAELLPVLSQMEWQERNPLLGYHSSLASKSGSQVLLVTRKQKMPAVVYGYMGQGRTALIGAGPLWRWKFLPEQGGVYDQLMTRLVDLLARGEEAGRFSLISKKTLFEAGEQIELFAEIFDAKMQPITGVPVRLEISGVDEGGAAAPLRGMPMERNSPQGTRYSTMLPPLPQGVYRLRAEADVRERTLQSPELEIRVSSISVEFQNVVQDRQRLQAIAKRSGGVYTHGTAIGRVVNAIPLQARARDTVSEITLRTNAILFCVVLLLLGVEWIIRKRAGMI
jgi:hypothetical protein